jgi:hypothetical protein
MRSNAPRRPDRLDVDLLVDVTRDEVDHWGEPPPDTSAEDDHYLRERPPHHGD